MAACENWPRTGLPGDFFEPFQLETEALLVSGANDSASPPEWGEEAKSFMPNAVHVVVPGGGHTQETDCTRKIRHELYRTGTTKGLDMSCAAKVEPAAPFKLPSQGGKK
jgi:hypothetical protein